MAGNEPRRTGTLETKSLEKDSSSVAAGAVVAGLVGDQQRLVRAVSGATYLLFDPGTSVHVEALGERIAQFGFEPGGVQFVLLTHAHPERISGVPYLLRAAPHARVVASAALRSALTADALRSMYDYDCSIRSRISGAASATQNTMQADEYQRLFEVHETLVDSDVLQVDDSLFVRAVRSPGHTTESFAYLVQPGQYIVSDEVCGYFRGQNLPAPGGDSSIADAAAALKQILNLELRGLCLPWGGTIVGSLMRKHLLGVVQTSEDIGREIEKGRAAGYPAEHLIQSIRESLYVTTSADVCLQQALARSLESLLSQHQLEATS